MSLIKEIKITAEPVWYTIHKFIQDNQENALLNIVDTPLSITTDGNFLYFEDIDNKGTDPFADGNFYTLKSYFNDFKEDFIEPMKKAETKLRREIFIADWGNMSDISIRQLELESLGEIE